MSDDLIDRLRDDDRSVDAVDEAIEEILDLNCLLNARNARIAALEATLRDWQSLVADLEDLNRRNLHVLREREDEVARLREAAREVWESVPSVYDSGHSTVRRHAAALNALGRAVMATP